MKDGVEEGEGMFSQLITSEQYQLLWLFPTLNTLKT